jgi:hypothetical protein
MQAFVNVATPPTLKRTQQGGKCYWEFRAAESAKNEQREAATWYTVRVFQEDDPGFSKGDFVRLIGKLKLDVFMGRDGRPMGVLVVMCYEAKRYEKPLVGKPDATSPQKADRDQMVTPGAKRQQAAVSSGQSPSIKAQENNEEVDEGWLALVA